MGSEMCIRDSDVVAGLDGLDAADVQPHRGVELQGVAAGGRLRVAEHDADLLAQLVGCLLYTSDAADERSSVDLGGRRII